MTGRSTKTRPAEARSPGTEPLFADRVLAAVDAGMPFEIIKHRFHLTDGEFEDITGEALEEPDETGRSPTTGY